MQSYHILLLQKRLQFMTIFPISHTTIQWERIENRVINRYVLPCCSCCERI